MAQNWWEQDQEVVPPASAGIPLSGPDPDLPVKRAAAAAELQAKLRAAQNAAVLDPLKIKAAELAIEKAEAEINKMKTGGTGKPMRQGDADKLEKQIDAYSYLKSSRDGFQNDYAGNTLTGRVENWAQRAIGTGTPGQADWWSNFKTADNIIRNEFFGASLTDGEKAAYAETTVDPSMVPSEVRKNLTRRTEIIQKALQRKVGRLRVVYNKEEIDAAVGEFLPDLLPKGQTPTISIEPPEDQKAVATGDTRTEVIRGPVEKKLAAMFASGAPSKDIRAYAKENNFPAEQINSGLAWRALNPKYKGAYDVSTQRILPTTVTNRVMASPLATAAVQAANASTAGLIDEMGGAARSLVTGEPLADTIALANTNKQAQAELNPTSALVGNVAGGAGTMLGAGATLKGLNLLNSARLAANPVKAAIAGDALYGAAYGAGESNDARLSGAGVGLVAGGLGSAAGTAGAKVIGKGMRGVVNPAAERLRARGIPLTAGEVLGGGWKKTQDAMTSVPIVGSMVARRNSEGREAFNRAAFNEAGEPIGARIDEVGQPAIEALNTAKSRAYSNALDPVELNLNDPAFINDLKVVGAKIAALPNDDNAQQAALEALTYRLGKNAQPGTARMTGRNFQEAYRGLARTPKERGPKAYAEEFRQIIQGGKDALTGVLERQNPGAYDAFLRANKANRGLSVLVDVVNAAKNQIDDGDPLFTPAQLATAATNNAKTFDGKAAAAMGNRPFNQLAKDAQEVMSQKVGDSGTATRAMIGAGMAGFGGGAGYGADGTSGAVTGAVAPAAVLTLLGTRRGQALLTAALMKRAPKLRNAGTSFANNPILGDIGAALGIANFAGQ